MLAKLLRTVIVLAVLGLLAQRGVQLYRAEMATRAAPPAVPTTRAARGDLAVLLAGNGTLEAEKTYVVANQEVMSQITYIVEDGVMVHRDQLLVQLDTTKIKKQVAEQRTALEQSKAQVAKVEAETLLEVNNAVTKTKKAQEEQGLLVATNRSQLDQVTSELDYNRAEMRQAERQRERKKGLARDLLIPAREADLAELTVASKGLNVTQGEKKLTLQQHQERAADAKGDLIITDARYSEQATRNKASEQLQNARFNADSAQRRIDLLELQLKWCVIPAPASGLTVVAREWDGGSGGPRPLRAGDTAFPMRRFMDIIDVSRMRIAANVSEIDISRVRAKLPVRIRPRSAPDTLLHGQVVLISSLARPGDVWRRNAIPGKRLFRMVIGVTESRPELLRPGMTVDFEIVERDLSDVLKVPVQAVFTSRKGASVFVKRGGLFCPTAVQVGVRNDTHVTITRGLTGNEDIALRRPPSELIDTGAKATGAKRRNGGTAERSEGVMAKRRNGMKSIEKPER